MKNKTLARDSYQYIDGFAKESHSNPGKLLKLLQSGLLMDMLSCVLLSSGLGFAVLTLINFEGGFLGNLGFACLSTLMFSAFRLKWWLAPATVSFFAASAALYLGFTGRMESAALYWAGFFEWVLKGAHYDKIYSENGGEWGLAFLVIFMAALICFVIIRKLFLFPVIIILTGSAFGVIYYLGRADLSVPLCTASAGIVILMPRVYSRYVSKRSGNAENRGVMQIVAVPAALIAMLFTMWIVPEDTSSWRSRELNNFIADVAYMFNGPFSSYPSNASNFSMRKLGFEAENGILGGPARLTDEKFLSVTAERPMLLRGAVKDFYTGKGWQIGAADGDFRFDSLFWQSYRRGAFNSGKPSGSEAKRLFESLTVQQNFTVDYQNNKFSTVFAGGILRDAEFAKNTVIAPIYFNMRSELYLHYIIPGWTKVQLDARVWNTEMAGFEDGLLRLEQLAANRGDRSFTQIKQRYTQLPDTLPESVAELAQNIAAESTSPYQKAKAIENWLRENCEYTLEPVIPPEDMDFVGHFLETKKGYCTYYASAMAVLARCVGLPSRYVTGFGLERDRRNKTLFLATGETAHAWAEIYFDGIGWVEFDPLNWNPSEPLNNEQADLPNSQPQPVITPPQASSNNIAPDENTGQIAAVRRTVGLRQALSFFSAAAVIYLIIRLAVYHIMRRKLRVYELSRISRKIPDIGKRMDFYFDDIFKQLSLLGIDPYVGETLTDFSIKVDRRLKLEGKSLAGIAEARMLMHFANAAPTPGDCEAVFQYHRELELLLRERLRKTAYFLKRAIRR